MKFLSIAAAIVLLQTAVSAAIAGPSRGIVVPAAFHFGTVKKGSVVTKQIAVMNSESVAAEKLVIESACSCTTIVSAPARLEPYHAGVITLRYAPNKAGDAKIDLLVSAKVNEHPMTSQIAASATIIEGGEQGVAQSDSPFPELQAEAAIKERNLVIVDIRSATEFSAVRIAGSLNLPLFALKAQDFLKTQPILLVNDGIVTREVQQEIEQLAKAGFRSVRYLHGGVRAWQWARGPLEGRSTGDASLLGMARLGEAEQNPSWNCVFVTSSEDVSKVVQSLKKEAVSGNQTLVIASDRAQYQQIEAKLAGSKQFVCYLNGTLSDWIQYHAAQSTLASRAPIVIGAPQTQSANIRSGKGSPCKTCR